MEYVDKSKGKGRAHSLLTGYLNRCLSNGIYPIDLYEAMKSDIEPNKTLNPKQVSTYKLLLKQILNESHIQGDGLDNDEGYCCYCMRRIKVNETHSTLEHVIPQTVEDEQTYRTYFNIPSELETNERIMVLKTIFLNKYHKRPMPFPHNVAYENLVGSCDGSIPKGSQNHKCCNGPRGSQNIPPLMFIKSIHQEIKYKKNGRIVWSDNPNIEKRERFRIIQEILHLNDSTLLMIRKIWCYLSEHNMNCNLDNGDRRKVIDTLRNQCDGQEKDVIQNFFQDNYWDLLEEYRYFNDATKFS